MLLKRKERALSNGAAGPWASLIVSFGKMHLRTKSIHYEYQTAKCCMNKSIDTKPKYEIIVIKLLGNKL